MSLVFNPIDALFNGVSQQPANMRLPSQCESQINGLSSVADGLGKRPPTEHLKKISATAFGSAFVHIINRDVTERYAVVITDEVLRVYDLSDGSSQTVTFEDQIAWPTSTVVAVDQLVRPGTANGALFRCTTGGTTGAVEPTWDATIGQTTADNTVTWTAIDNYLAIPAGAKASESFEVVTVADYSFIVNKTKTVKTRTTGTGTHQNFSDWYFPDNWELKGEDTRYFFPNPGVDKGKEQTLEDLPKAEDPSPPVEGHFYEIEGVTGSFSRYYVIYLSGVWQETHARNLSISLDEATMPHALVRETDNNFHVREFGWVPRLFGDLTTNPVPSFVDKQIKDIGYHKNRLVFAAGENIIFSGAGDYGNLFRNTVIQLLDSDVVDIAVSTQQVAEVNYILPTDRGMMFFADQTQFILNVDELLTPNTTSIDVATSYEMNQFVKPIAVGSNVFFMTETGDWSRCREYAFGGGKKNVITSANDITAHVNKFIPSGAFRMAGSSNEDIILVISNKATFRNRVYVYKFFFNGDQKVQSAWSYWEFATDDVILDISILNNVIYFIIERADGVFLETMNVSSTSFPLALTFDLLVDRRYLFLGGDKSFDATDTTFTLPYTLTSAEQTDFRLLEGDGATPGRLIDPTTYVWLTSSTVKVVSDYTGIEVFGGLNYDFTYTFSEQFHRRPDGISITTGRYQLRTFTIVYEDMAFFNTEVDPYGDGNGLTEAIVTRGLSVFTGKTLGSGQLVLDAPVFDKGTYAFQIYGNSKNAIVALSNDSPFGGNFVSATVEGFFTNRGA